MTEPEDHSMINPDERDELTTLAKARAGLSPSPADALRVRASLAAAIAAPVATEAASSGWGRSAGRGEGWPLRVLVASVAAAAIGAGAGGYWMGYRAGSREAPVGAVQNETSPSVSPSPASAVAGGGAPSSSSPPLTAPVADVATTQEIVRRRPGNMARSARPAGVASPAEALGQEVRALRAVEHALREDDPRLALAILQQLDRDVPKGKLVEERRATSVIARCAAGDVPFGVDLAADFAGDYPESVYLGRVQQSCQRGRPGQ